MSCFRLPGSVALFDFAPPFPSGLEGGVRAGSYGGWSRFIGEIPSLRSASAYSVRCFDRDREWTVALTPGSPVSFESFKKRRNAALNSAGRAFVVQSSVFKRASAVRTFGKYRVIVVSAIKLRSSGVISPSFDCIRQQCFCLPVRVLGSSDPGCPFSIETGLLCRSPLECAQTTLRPLMFNRHPNTCLILLME